MSKEFDQIKNIIKPEISKEELERRENEYKANELKREQEEIITRERIERDKLILEKSGIKSLFEEIRDNRLVVWDNIKEEKQKRISEKNWRGKEIGYHYEFEKVSDYHPAIIVESSYYDEGKIAGVSLRFNGGIIPDTSDSITSFPDKVRFNEVRVVVKDGVLNIGVPKERAKGSWKNTYTEKFVEYIPIEEGNLANTIAGAIKKPIYNESEVNRHDGSFSFLFEEV